MNATNNVYAPPAHAHHGAPSFASPVSIDGKALVVPNGMPFPSVCLKCGKTHDLEARRQKYQYVPPAARFFGPLIQMIFRKTSEFLIPVCKDCNGAWKKWNLIAGVSWIPGLLFIFLGPAIGDDAGGLIALFGFVALLGALIVALVMRNGHIIGASKIDKTHTWLTNVSPQASYLLQNPQATVQQAPAQYGYAA